MKKLFLIINCLLLTLPNWATTYYVHPKLGNNANNGTSISHPFQSLAKINTLKLTAGDQVMLATGYTFFGTLELQNLTGTAKHPIIIKSYSQGKNGSKARPIINAKGFLNGILIKDCSHIRIMDLEITANGGGSKESEKKGKLMRCGVLVTTSQPAIFKGITLQNLWIHNIFFEKKGFNRGTGEVKTPNGKQNYGWGIRFINTTRNALLRDLMVKSCTIRNVAHTGIKFTGNKKNIQNIRIMNNQVKETGGPGIQMSGVQKGMVRNNIVSYSGSNNDSRKWGRGSGLWTWGTSNVIIEHNSFKNAHGPGDSAGCHIDYNCNNVIVQYNLSINNAGGFCEILGNNFNCAYRYNISVNDGYRIKGKNGAFQEGKIFWLSGYQGKKKKHSGPFNSYFYNNTIYVKKGITAKIAVTKASAGILIANNIFYIEGNSETVLGDQYRPEIAGVSRVKNIIFKNNLFLRKDTWPSDVLIQDEKPFYGDPNFAKSGGKHIENYLPENKKLVKNMGIKIQPIPHDSIGIFIGLDVDRDILGKKIKGKPDVGAIEY